MKARSRESADTLESMTLGVDNYVLSSGNYSSHTNFGVYTLSTSRVMNGFDLEHYQERKNRGELLPMTPFTDTDTGIVSFRGNVDVQCASTNTRNVGTSPAGFGLLAFKDSEIASLSSKFNSDALSQQACAAIYTQYSHDTLTFLSELHKVIAMFKGLQHKAAYLMGNPKLTAKDLTGLWVEARYGWRPLVYDIMSFQDALTSLEDKRTRYKKRIGYTENVNDYSIVVGGPSLCGMGNTYASQVEGTISYRGNAIADIEPPSFQFNLAITAWELTPLSFIVDWVLNVGQWLEGLSFLLLQNGYVASAGFKLNVVKTMTVIDTRPITYADAVGVYDTEGVSYLNQTVRVPARVTPFPQFTPNLDVPKIIDLWAIFAKTSRSDWNKFQTRR
jgi:hypothetical protein